MEEANVGWLEGELRKLGLDPSPAAVQGIVRHLDLVAEWNERVNLTAITGEREMLVKHAIDSATLFAVAKIGVGKRVVDVGTGAGFPGVVLKCLVPGIRLTLVESLAKRCRFLEAVGAEVVPSDGHAANGYEVVWGRAEDLAQKTEYREQYDLVVARAVAELRVLSELCLPFCRVGGEFIAMKGPGAGEEINGAERALVTLGGQLDRVTEIELPEGAGKRTLVRIRKVRNTPKVYPRRAGTPGKSPL